MSSLSMCGCQGALVTFVTFQDKILVVGRSGLEPPTSRLSGECSNQLSYEPLYGGDEEDRTPDPLLAKQVLSQLSYTPICFESSGHEPSKLNSIQGAH